MHLFASDFSGLAYYALAIMAAVGLGCLFLGFITSGVLVWVTKRRWLWLLTPVAAVVWFAIGWFALLLFGY